MIHVFLLIVLLNGEKQGDDIFFRDVNSCAYYAREIVSSSMFTKDNVTALCDPKVVNEKEETIY